MSLTRKEHLDNMVCGNIVAFTNGVDMFSGKVISVEGNFVTVQTLNGSIFYKKKDDIKWVKNGSKWPVGIFNALKRSKNTMKDKV